MLGVRKWCLGWHENAGKQQEKDASQEESMSALSESGLRREKWRDSCIKVHEDEYHFFFTIMMRWWLMVESRLREEGDGGGSIRAGLGARIGVGFCVMCLDRIDKRWTGP